MGSIPHSPQGESFSREEPSQKEDKQVFNELTDSPIKSAYIERLMKDMEEEKK